MACFHPKKILIYDTHMAVPCGKCLGCRQERKRHWVYRLNAELPYHPVSTFATLTYNDEVYYDESKDTPYAVGSLYHRHVQLFLKRLRRRISPTRIKYFCCGEYGTSTYRAHYHIIIFGYWPSDAKKNQFTDDYSSPSLTKDWSYGDVRLGLVEPGSVRYVAGYVNKKSEDYLLNAFDGIREPYVACSKGIGKDYCLENAKQLSEQLMVYIDGHPAGLPRYYKKLLEIPTSVLLEAYERRNDLILERALNSGTVLNSLPDLVSAALRNKESAALALEKLRKKDRIL